MAHTRFEAERRSRARLRLAALLAFVVVALGLSASSAMAQEHLAADDGGTETTDTGAETGGTGDGTVDEPTETVPGVPDELLVRGADLYTASCSSCHQPRGAGLEGQFPPLIGNPNVQGQADYVREVINNGRQGELVVDGVTYNGVMPAFSTLPDEDVDAIVAYVTNGFVTPAAVVEEVAGGETGTSLPGLANMTYVLAMVIAAGLGVYALAPRIVGQVDRLQMPWLDAWLKTAVIVVGFILATVYIPSEILKTDYVTRLGDFGQNVIGLGLWGGGLVIGIWALWYAHRDRRI